ncbi:MAG: site-specific integrase [Pirellulales bacterium]
MPKLSNSLPKYRCHKASGQAIVTLAGKHHYLGPHGTKASRLEYDRLIGEWITKGKPNAGERCRTDLTINELLAAYLRFATGYYPTGSSGEMNGIKRAMRPLREAYGRIRVSEFGPLALKAVRQRMIEMGWVRTSVNHQIQRVRRFFKWGVENELVPASVLHALQAVPGLKFARTEAAESEPIKPVPESHVDAVITKVSGPVAAMIELQRLTGMRSGEVVIMRACDIDMSGRVWVFRPDDHKNKWRGHQRFVYLGPKAQGIVRRFLKTQTDAYLFSPADAVAERATARSRNRKTPMSCGNRPGSNRRVTPRKKPGNRYDVASYRRAIVYGIKLAGVPAWHPHQLRHNHATMVRRQYGLEVARILLGHKTAAVTEIYAEADQQKAVEIAAKIG